MNYTPFLFAGIAMFAIFFVSVFGFILYHAARRLVRSRPLGRRMQNGVWVPFDPSIMENQRLMDESLRHQHGHLHQPGVFEQPASSHGHHHHHDNSHHGHHHHHQVDMTPPPSFDSGHHHGGGGGGHHHHG